MTTKLDEMIANAAREEVPASLDASVKSRARTLFRIAHTPISITERLSFAALVLAGFVHVVDSMMRLTTLVHP